MEIEDYDPLEDVERIRIRDPTLYRILTHVVKNLEKRSRPKVK